MKRQDSAKTRRPTSRSSKSRPKSSRHTSSSGVGGDGRFSNDRDAARLETNLSPWEAFQEHLRLIDDSAVMYSIKEATMEGEQDRIGDAGEPGLTPEQAAQQVTSAIKCRSSDAFAKVMYDLQLKKQQHLERMAAAQRERERRALEEAATGEITLEEEAEPEEDFEPDWSDDEVIETPEDRAKAELQKSATRAWALIRRHIQELRMQKKNAGSTMNWSFLRQTLAHMTDMEKGRQDLYEKYLDKPDTWREGFVNFPEELFNKEKTKGRRGQAASSRSSKIKDGGGSQTDRSKNVATH